MNDSIGKEVSRIDGRLKVQGTAVYAAEFKLPGMVYGVIVQSTISKGRIADIDTKKAQRAKGVVSVITYKNAMSLHFASGSDPSAGHFGEKDLLPLQSDRIFYDGQHIAIVLAETFEQAEYAATLVKVSYENQPPVCDLRASIGTAYKPSPQASTSKLQDKRGDADKAMETADQKIDQTYSTPVYHHNPMEPHATVAVWKDDKLTVYDSTQSVVGSRNVIAQLLGISPEKVRLVCPFLGGGFGCKGFAWAHSTMAAMAAKMTGRPVKIVLSREQMFTSNGRRSETIQRIGIGTDKQGKISSIRHKNTVETSFVDEFIETSGLATSITYDTPNLEVSHELVRLNKGTPCPMRAPGEATGMYALEVAMDEMAHKLGMNPVEFRELNYTERNPQKNQEWSEKSLKECYDRGQKMIGWEQRKSEPGSTKEGGMLVGYGMATATYPANRSPASVKLQIGKDGKVLISCATQDIGTGTYTIMAQTAAGILGLPLPMISVKLGDTDLPKGPNSGGSQTSASTLPAVRAAAMAALTQAIRYATSQPDSALYKQNKEEIKADNGKLVVTGRPEKADTFNEIIRRQNLDEIKVDAMTDVSTREASGPPSPKSEAEQKIRTESDANPAVLADEKTPRKDYAFHSFGAHFVKVLVDPDLGIVRVVKCASVMDIGTVLNPKTARSQIMGGIIFGIGMTLMEETAYDPQSGRVVTHDLASYLVPVHADMPEFDIDFINAPDPHISPIGSRGIGEIGVTGVTAAIANAIFNATGKRIRDLPITPDKLIVALTPA